MQCFGNNPGHETVLELYMAPPLTAGRGAYLYPYVLDNGTFII